MAPREQDKASANLLRASLRDSADPCPDPEILAAYFERSLDADETRHYELHLSQCAHCREQLAAMHRAGEFAPAGRAETQQAARWAWLWDWRLLAPALAVLVIAAVWIARRPAPNRMTEKSHQPLVAVNQPAEQPASPTPLPAPAPIPGQYSNFVARVPNKALTAPDASVTGSIKQSPAARQNEIASNQTVSPGNGRELDELRKDEKSLNRDSTAAANGVVAGAAQSQAIVAPSAPAPPPVAAASPERTRSDAGAVGGVITEKEVTANASAAAKAKPSGPPSPVRTLTTQAQVQTAMQSQALVLEAGDRSATGTIIATPDPKVIWRIAEGGFVERTTDGGTSWQGQLPDPSAQLAAGSAPSVKICWFVGNNGVILLTKDAKTWKRVRPPLTADFVAVTAQDDSTATITTADGRRFMTTDGGKHWNPAP